MLFCFLQPVNKGNNRFKNFFIEFNIAKFITFIPYRS